MGDGGSEAPPIPHIFYPLSAKWRLQLRRGPRRGGQGVRLEACGVEQAVRCACWRAARKPHKLSGPTAFPW